MSDVFKIIKKFKRRISEKFGKSEVILFGSQARGNARKESDIDVLVILYREVDIGVREAVYDIAFELGLEYDVVLDVSVYSKKEWDRFKGILPLIINAQKEGIVV